MSPVRVSGSPSGLLLLHKGMLLAASLAGLWLIGATAGTRLVVVLAAYALLNLLLGLGLVRYTRRAAAWYLLSYSLDYLLILYLLFATGGFSSPFWPLLAFQPLLPALYLSWPLLSWAGAFLAGPIYLLALVWHGGSLAFLSDPLFLVRYTVLFLGAIAATLAATHLQSIRRREHALRETLATREAELEAQTQRLQRTAEDLGGRVLQLRSLQEVARALASTLDLPETLQVLVDRIATLAGVHYAAIALLDQDNTCLQGVAASGPAPDTIREFRVSLTLPDMEQLATGNIVTSRESRGLGFARLAELWGLDTFLCLPLVLRGRPLGALYLGDERPDFDTSRQRQLLDSFSYFAAAAVENAQLYQAVADKSRELETILAGIGDGVLVVDAELRLVLMNPVAARVFALDGEPPAGVPISLVVPHEEFLALLADVQARPGDAVIREVELQPTGSERRRTYQALATPLLVGTNLQGIATVLRDITSQKELERMKSNFLSVVSHELKTPLHSIKGFVDIILMGKTGEVSEIQRDFLETVKQQTGHLQRMIDDLLEFSRLESGRVSLRLQPVDIPVVIEAVIDKLTPLADSAEVTLVNRAPDDLPTISADPWRLEQVVTNLVDNAIKFSPPHGEVVINAEDRGDCIQVSVKDNGIGIAADEIDRIFDRFYQIDGGVNRLYKGTGLGLTICRHIVEHHGGRIWAESERGRGATLIFTIPKHLHPADVGALDFTTLPEDQRLESGG
ncbi:MAG: GAF domain-containing protein [Caldilineae bacterium]|nr:MAG: GAF domain-containing protein [Caldilineae bacterium]